MFQITNVSSPSIVIFYEFVPNPSLSLQILDIRLSWKPYDFYALYDVWCYIFITSLYISIYQCRLY